MKGNKLMAKYLDKEGLVAYDAAIKKYNKVYIKAAETPEAGYAATYEIYQGVNDLGAPTGTASKINIPFSKVLKSGELREDTDRVYIDLFFDEDKTDKISVDITSITTDIDNLQKEIVKLEGEDNVEGSIKNLIKEHATVSITTNTTTEGALKTYTFTQNGTEIGKVDIPKDFLVKSGKVTEFTKIGELYYQDGENISALPDGVTEDKLGKYIELVINVQEGTVDNQKIYIYVKDLVDVYEGTDNNIIKVVVGSNNKISATIDNAAITKAMLSQEVLDSIAATGESLVFKGTIATLPTTAKVGEVYLSGNKLYICTVASSESVTPTYAEVAIDEAFLTSILGTDYKVNAKASTVKTYIDSRVFMGTESEIAAAKAAGKIDDTTITIVVDESAEEFIPITDEEIAAMFA